jgi:GT2 family glycosyltransferase
MIQAGLGNSRIFILLPVHNRRATTALFIDSLMAQAHTNWHLVLIDDGSSDDTEAMVRERVTALTVLRGKGDWWWAGALQQGYRWLKRQTLSDDDIVLIINDDTEFDRDFLTNAVATLAPRSLLLAQLYDQAGEFVEAGVRWDWRRFAWAGVKAAEGINCFSTRGLFLRARDFFEIGGFHPTLLPHYLSDYEFTMRAHRKGFALISDPRVFLRYNENLTGIRSNDETAIVKRAKRDLSIKSANNPVYWTSFILLACPVRHIPVNVAIVWTRFFGPLVRQIRINRAARRAVRG